MKTWRGQLQRFMEQKPPPVGLNSTVLLSFCSTSDEFHLVLSEACGCRNDYVVRTLTSPAVWGAVRVFAWPHGKVLLVWNKYSTDDRCFNNRRTTDALVLWSGDAWVTSSQHLKDRCTVCVAHSGQTHHWRWCQWNGDTFWEYFQRELSRYESCIGQEESHTPNSDTSTKHRKQKIICIQHNLSSFLLVLGLNVTLPVAYKAILK